MAEEFKKNKIWGCLSTVDNINRLRTYPFFYANSDHCLVIADEQPAGTVEMTQEFMERFKADDWLWISRVIGRVQKEQEEKYPEAAEELEKENQEFLEKFRSNLEAWRSKNGTAAGQQK